MQSAGISFYGDVVLDSLNNASREKHNILDQIYKGKYARNIITMILFLFNIKNKYHYHNSSIKTQFYEFLVVMCYEHICSKMSLVKVVRDDISAKTIPIWLRHTVLLTINALAGTRELFPDLSLSSWNPTLIWVYLTENLKLFNFLLRKIRDVGWSIRRSINISIKDPFQTPPHPTSL